MPSYHETEFIVQADYLIWNKKVPVTKFQTFVEANKVDIFCCCLQPFDQSTRLSALWSARVYNTYCV
jgi:hypothetical protein